jgi:hypothetical protein
MGKCCATERKRATRQGERDMLNTKCLLFDLAGVRGTGPRANRRHTRTKTWVYHDDSLFGISGQCCKWRSAMHKRRSATSEVKCVYMLAILHL